MAEFCGQIGKEDEGERLEACARKIRSISDEVPRLTEPQDSFYTREVNR